MSERRGLWRSRWAAIGAAVAVTLGAGGLVAVNAASSVQSSMVTTDPVRILDTRTDVGLPGPFVSAVSQKLQVTGSTVPAGSTGVLLNVTVVTPTAAGFLSIRPGDQSGAASTSSLNFTAGDIVPNAVQVGLPTSGANAGQIDIAYDAYGQAGPTTEVLIDVVGYMAPTDAYTKAQTDAALAGKANAADVYTTAELDAYLAYADGQIGAALDGKVDKGSPIVMTHGAGEFARYVGPLPTKFESGGHILFTSGDGVIIMPLSAPTSVGGISYRLSSVQWCLADRLGPTYGAYVAGAEVIGDTGSDSFPGSARYSFAVDTTQRPSAFGCYTLSVPPPMARGYSLILQLGGQTTNLTEAGLLFRSVRSTWIPA